MPRHFQHRFTQLQIAIVFAQVGGMAERDSCGACNIMTNKIYEDTGTDQDWYVGTSGIYGGNL